MRLVFNSASKVFDVRAASSQLAVHFRTVSGLHLGRGGVSIRHLGTPESESAPLNCPTKPFFSLFHTRFEFSK